MRRYSILLIILAISMVVSSTFAWLTYVQRKSLAAFETHEILITLEANDTQVINLISQDNLAFIDYEKDFVTDEFDALNVMASVLMIKMQTSSTSPLSKHQLTLTCNQIGLIYLLVYDGINDLVTPPIETYDLLVNSIISSYSTKAEQLLAISNYNQNILDYIYSLTFSPNDFIRFQIVVWGDYDALEVQSTYLQSTFDFVLTIESVNSKGEVTA